MFINSKQKIITQAQQVRNIAFITFWSQFASYTLNMVLILYLTMPLIKHGLGMTQSEAYIFFSVIAAVGYLMPMLGGFISDHYLGVRRAIMVGSVMLAVAYCLVMLSGYASPHYARLAFIASYSLIPVSSSLLTGTATALITRIYKDNEHKTKGAMTLYYISINVGSLLAALISPKLINSHYGALSVFFLVFIGKAISALNFAYCYRQYKNVIGAKDKAALTLKTIMIVVGYVVVVYCLTFLAFDYPKIASYLIGVFCCVGIVVFILRTATLVGEERVKQFIALILMLVAIIFYVLYNQMNTTMIIFAQHNTDLKLLGLNVSPASYQLVNPLAILIFGSLLPRFYRAFPQLTIPYQFAIGIVISGIGMWILTFASHEAYHHVVNGNFVALSYFFISISELFISAVGLSMVGLYCSPKMIAFAMGVFYLGNSLSNIASGKLAEIVALPKDLSPNVDTLSLFSHYYWQVGLVAIVIGVILFFAAKLLHIKMRHWNIQLS